MPAPGGSRQRLVRDAEPARYHGGPRAVTTLIVIHCTAGDDVPGAVQWMNRLHPPGEEGQKSSYHYLVGKDGLIWRHCPRRLIAYHAGDSAFPLQTPGPKQFTSVNGFSLGIALTNDDGTDDDPADDAITSEQFTSFDWLVRSMMATYAILPGRVLGHREVSPGRKYDPRPHVLDLPAYRASLASPVR